MKTQMFHNQNGSSCSGGALQETCIAHTFHGRCEPTRILTQERGTFTSTVAHGFRPLEGKSLHLVLLLFVPFGSLFTMVLGKIWNSCWIWFGNLALFVTSRALPHLAPILGDWHPVRGSGICMFPALHKGLWYVVMTKSHLWGPCGPW